MEFLNVQDKIKTRIHDEHDEILNRIK